MSPTNGNEQAPGPEKRNSGLSARAILHAVRRRPVTLLGVTLLALGTGAAVWLFLPFSKTTAATVFHVSNQEHFIVAPTAGGRADATSYRASQAAAIKRRLTLSDVLKQPEVQYLDIVRKQPDALGWLDAALKVETRPNSEAIRVSIEGENPNELLAILQALQKAYLADVNVRDNRARLDRLNKIEEKNRQYQKELEKAHTNIDTIARELGSTDGPTLALFEAQRREDLKVALRTLTEITEQLELAENELKGKVPVPPPAKMEPGFKLPWNLVFQPKDPFATDPQIETLLSEDAGVKELVAQVIRAEQVLIATKGLFRAGERPPAVVKAEENLKAAELKRDRYKEETRPKIVAALRKQHDLKEQARQQSRMDTLRETVETSRKREAQIQARANQLKEAIIKANDRRLELEKLQSSIGRDEKLSERLATEAEQLKIEMGAQSRVSSVEDPYIVTGIEGNRRLKFTLLSTLVILFVGFTGVVAWEYRYRRLTHTDDVTTALGVRLIGAVPLSGGGPDKGHGSHPVLVEAIDATRTMLLNGAHDSDLRVLVVTSAVSGEGKTSLSGHLAISLARAGFRTLLVDGDLRAPTAHRVFDIPLAPGLCEFLQGGIGVAAATRPAGVPGLSVMTAGEWTFATRHALVGTGWRTAKEQLKAEFDFVVVDTSPLLLVSDTLLLAREADGVVVSVLMGVSQVALVDEAITRLQTVRAKVTGVIANGVRSAAHEYNYGYGHKPAPARAINPAPIER